MRAGLADPMDDSQRVFRAVLEAMAHPGRVVDVGIAMDPPPPLGSATAAVCLALLDCETPIWLDAAAATADVVEYLRVHAGAPVVVQVDALRTGAGIRFGRPGTAGVTALDVGGAWPALRDILSDDARRFPRGVDLVLTAGTRLAAIPRTARVVAWDVRRGRAGQHTVNG